MMVMGSIRHRLTSFVGSVRRALIAHVWAWPAATHATGTGGDMLRGRAQLLTENALLLQQVVVLRRDVTRHPTAA